jgi:Family of unknown function (DUF6055)
MRARRRIAVALLLAAVSLTTAGVAAAQAQGERGEIQTSISSARATRVLQTAKATFADPARSGKRELTPLILRLVQAIPSMSPEQRHQANKLLARPTDNPDPQQSAYKVPEHQPPFCTPHFCLHWVDTTADAPPPVDVDPANGVPDFVDEVAAVAEHSYSVENDQLGWQPPLSDGSRGGDSRTDIYLANVGVQGLFGYSAPDPGQGLSPHQFAYLVMDNDFSAQEFPGTTPLADLEVTFAHEYNHVLQFGYSAFQDLWHFEDSAVWMEDQVYPDVNDYLRYVGAFSGNTRLPITAADRKVYGDAVINHWLAGRYGPNIIRDSWVVGNSTKPKFFSVAAYNKVIRAAGGKDLAHEFSLLAAASAEWRTPGVFPYSDAPTWPDVRRAGRLRPHHVFATRLNHTGYVVLNVKPSHARKLVLIAGSHHGDPAAFALVGRTGPPESGSVQTAFKFAQHGGIHTVVLRNPGQFTRISAVLVNAETRQAGFGAQDWIYRHDHTPFAATVVRR